MLVRAIALGFALLLATAPAGAVDTGAGGTLSDVRELIAAEDWTRALSIVKRIVAGEPDNPDALNLLAYTLRHTGELPRAEGFYLKALSIAPLHLGANEYLGELYVQTGALDKARERLAVLEAACSTDCEEYRALAAAIAGPEATRQPRW